MRSLHTTANGTGRCDVFVRQFFSFFPFSVLREFLDKCEAHHDMVRAQKLPLALGLQESQSSLVFPSSKLNILYSLLGSLATNSLYLQTKLPQPFRTLHIFFLCNIYNDRFTTLTGIYANTRRCSCMKITCLFTTGKITFNKASVQLETLPLLCK